MTMTPKIMRRTLKITGNLSGCADDIGTLKQFEAAQVFRTPDSNKSSSDLSYESASSNSAKFKSEDCEFQSAEDVLDNVLASAGCKEFFDSQSNFLETHFDMFDEPYKSPEQDPDMVSNMAIDLTLGESHRAIFPHVPSPSVADSWSVSRSTPDTTKNVTFNPQVINITTTADATERWNLFRPKARPKMSLPPPLLCHTPLKTILSNKRHHHSDELTNKRYHHSDEGIFMTKSEAALNAMSGGSSANSGERERTSPTLLQRKKYVYPLELTLKGSESSV